MYGLGGVGTVTKARVCVDWRGVETGYKARVCVGWGEWRLGTRLECVWTGGSGDCDQG